jgi:hypothetical protein
LLRKVKAYNPVRLTHLLTGEGQASCCMAARGAASMHLGISLDSINKKEIFRIIAPFALGQVFQGFPRSLGIPSLEN